MSVESLSETLMPLLQGAGTWVAVVLTLFVFSYLLGDNVLYRLAEHIFVGVAVGYAVVVAFHQVLLPKLLLPMRDALMAPGGPDMARLLLTSIPLVLGLFLLTKSFRRTRALSWLGSFSLACLLGVGGALAIGGALTGTLLPQIDATADVTRYVGRYGPGLGLFSGIVVLAGTVGVLLHFYYGTNQEGRLVKVREWLVWVWGGLGRWFVLVAFAALLATIFLSRLSLLADRIQFLLDAVRGLIGGLG
jgi:hypothetical protein